MNQLYRTGVRTGELKCFPVTSVVVRGSESEAEPCKELGSGTVGKSLVSHSTLFKMSYLGKILSLWGLLWELNKMLTNTEFN